MMAASESPLDSLFKRFKRYGNRDGIQQPNFVEFPLFRSIPVEEVLAKGNTWDDLCRFVIGKIVTMAPGVYVGLSLCDAGESAGSVPF
jgi:hypothetical protein